MDAVWTALEGARPCRLKEFTPSDERIKKRNKFLDWMSL